MNSYFYKIFIPYLILSMLGIYYVINDIILLWSTLTFWILIGPIGLGIGFHRLFSHRQFETYRPVELFLAIMGTISTYGPLLFWVSSHQAHHKNTDTDLDPTSPTRGFWHCVLTWNLKKQCEKEIILKSFPSIKVLRDPILMWLSRNFFLINYVFLAILCLINYQIAIAGYVVATSIEKVRIGFFVNYLMHKKIIGSYKNSDSTDNSINLPWIYPLTMGFSFHNQHHFKPMVLNEKTRWFEINIEYYLCRLISKNDKNII
jgi:fatty-acid desaturase